MRRLMRCLVLVLVSTSCDDTSTGPPPQLDVSDAVPAGSVFTIQWDVQPPRVDPWPTGCETITAELMINANADDLTFTAELRQLSEGSDTTCNSAYLSGSAPGDGFTRPGLTDKVRFWLEDRVVFWGSLTSDGSFDGGRTYWWAGSPAGTFTVTEH